MRTTLLALVAVCGLTSAAAAQSTAFTYQGRLKNGAAPATGLHDFRFTLFNAASGGEQIATPQCVDNAPVAGGLFTTALDFGPQFVTTEARFLQIEVRSDTGLGCANLSGFVTLGPRQPLTAAPLATHARSAFSLAAADGSPADAVNVDNGGNVGIGTTTPGTPLHIARDVDPVLVIQDTGPASTQAGYVGFWNNSSAETGWMGFGSPGIPHFSIVNARPGGHISLLPTGNVGIGTTAPLARLDVRGNIRLGSTGQFSAVGGVEDLRLVRGDIDGNGSIVRGTGFSVNRVGEGVYDFTFNPAFSGVPTITATAVIGVGGQPRWATSAEFFLSASSARIVVMDDGALTDSDFAICVIGPR